MHIMFISYCMLYSELLYVINQLVTAYVATYAYTRGSDMRDEVPQFDRRGSSRTSCDYGIYLTELI